MVTGQALVIRGDAGHLPLPDASVDLLVTSPPYYALRSYLDGGVHYEEQIGSEPTPAAYIDALLACTAEWMRVLKPSGSMFVDLGDKYSSPSGHTDDGASTRLQGRPNLRKQGRPDRGTATFGIPAKSLMLLPERYRIGCVDRLGLICRSVIIWSKPNCLPESVTDRVRRAHEDWVHLTKAPRYYSAVDEIRESHIHPSNGAVFGGARKGPLLAAQGRSTVGSNAYDSVNPLGKLPGSVWSIPSEPLSVPAHLGVDHFAAFPTEWPRRLIVGWSPPGICLQCGEGRRPVADVRYLSRGDTFAGGTLTEGRHRSGTRMGDGARATITGYACACTPHTDHPERRSPSMTPGRAKQQDQTTREALDLPRRHGNDWPARTPTRDYHLDQWTPPPTRPAVVLDPFGGTGTTALVAKALGRIGITVDMSHDYSRLAAWRTTNHRELAKAMRIPRPDPIPEGQPALDIEWP